MTTVEVVFSILRSVGTFVLLGLVWNLYRRQAQTVGYLTRVAGTVRDHLRDENVDLTKVLEATTVEAERDELRARLTLVTRERDELIAASFEAEEHVDTFVQTAFERLALHIEAAGRSSASNRDAIYAARGADLRSRRRQGRRPPQSGARPRRHLPQGLPLRSSRRMNKDDSCSASSSSHGGGGGGAASAAPSAGLSAAPAPDAGGAAAGSAARVSTEPPRCYRCDRYLTIERSDWCAFCEPEKHRAESAERVASLLVDAEGVRTLRRQLDDLIEWKRQIEVGGVVEDDTDADEPADRGLHAEPVPLDPGGPKSVVGIDPAMPGSDHTVIREVHAEAICSVHGAYAGASCPTCRTGGKPDVTPEVIWKAGGYDVPEGGIFDKAAGACAAHVDALLRRHHPPVPRGRVDGDSGERAHRRGKQHRKRLRRVLVTPKVTVRHADGTSEVVRGWRELEVERPHGTMMVECGTCGVGHDGSRCAFFVDVLDPRLPDGPFSCGASPAPATSLRDHDVDLVDVPCTEGASCIFGEMPTKPTEAERVRLETIEECARLFDAEGKEFLPEFANWIRALARKAPTPGART